MTISRINSLAAIVVIAAATIGCTSAMAQDFFTTLFGGFSQRSERPVIRMPFATELPNGSAAARSDDDAPRHRAGSQAFCVRTCDGRYFPIATGDSMGKATACSNFCPATETKVYYGSTIDRSASENGRRYGDLPNAFKYRTALVAGCTCNGKTTGGLAPVKIEDDLTLRGGDIVAGADGIVIDRRGAANVSPVTPVVLSRENGRMPVAAAE